MDLKGIILSIAFLLSIVVGYSQTTAFGLMGASVYYEGTSGSQLGFSLKSSIKGKLYFFGETNWTRLDDYTKFKNIYTDPFGNTSETNRVFQTNLIHAHCGLEYAVASIGKIDLALSLSGGFIKNSIDYFGLMSGGIILESKITDHISIGLPINYSFITWRNDKMQSLGLRLSYCY